MIPTGTTVRITRGTYAGWIGEVEGKEDSAPYDPKGKYYSIVLRRLGDNKLLKEIGASTTFSWVVREDGLEVVKDPGPNLAFKIQKKSRWV